MSRQIVYVREDYRVEVVNHSDGEIANSEGMVSPGQYEATKKSFEAMLSDLQKIVDDGEYRATHAAEFVRRHGVWLHNLAKTGFAIDYAQFVQEPLKRQGRSYVNDGPIGISG
jgi:hypothetical protein